MCKSLVCFFCGMRTKNMYYHKSFKCKKWVNISNDVLFNEIIKPYTHPYYVIKKIINFNIKNNIYSRNYPRMSYEKLNDISQKYYLDNKLLHVTPNEIVLVNFKKRYSFHNGFWKKGNPKILLNVKKRKKPCKRTYTFMWFFTKRWENLLYHYTNNCSVTKRICEYCIFTKYLTDIKKINHLLIFAQEVLHELKYVYFHNKKIDKMNNSLNKLVAL